MSNNFQHASLDELESKDQENLNSFIGQLLQLKQYLNNKSPRFNVFLERLEEIGRTEGTFFQYLCNGLIE